MPTLPPAVADVLDAVRRRHLKVRVRQFPVLVIAGLSLAWLLQAIVDRFFKLSWEVRAGLLAVDALLVLVLLWQYVVVPIYRRLNRRSAALLVEREMPEFDTSLISAVEFCESKEDFPRNGTALVTGLLNQVSRQIAIPGLPLKVVDSSALRRRVRWAFICAILLVGASVFAGSQLSWLLGRRIFLSKVALPGATEVTGITGDFMVDAGMDATVAVKAAGVIPPSGTLTITSEGEVSTIPVSLTHVNGENVYRYTVKNVRQLFTYRFAVNDGESAQAEVQVNVPPTLKSIRFVQVYPPYTGLPETVMSPGNLRLLEGSKLRIEGVASQRLLDAKLVIKGDDKVVELEKKGDDPAAFSGELTVPEKGWKSMSIRLNAGQGRLSTNEPVYRVDILNDRPPSVVMTLPKKDRITVIPGATVDLAFKVSDDYGLHSIYFCYRVLRQDGSGDTYPLDERQIPVKFAKGQKTYSGTMKLNLATIGAGVPAGCTVNCWVESNDNNAPKGTSKTGSREKVIAVISEEEKRMELLELMGQRAKDVERLYDQQRGINQRAEDALRGK